MLKEVVRKDDEGNGKQRPTCSQLLEPQVSPEVKTVKAIKPPKPKTQATPLVPLTVTTRAKEEASKGYKKNRSRK